MNVYDLVGKGYFPKELPIMYNTTGMSDVIDQITGNLHFPFELNRKGHYALITKMIPYSIPKIRAYRRNIGIPHPLPYIRMANHMCNNWTDILAYAESPLSLSPLKEEAGSERSLVDPSFDVITRERILRSVDCRFALRVDIQRFYSSIYTHSIPWVLHTKAVAKAQRFNFELLGNMLDLFCRNMQDGQTIGIPIGTDTSRAISEMIAAYIDKELEKRLNIGPLKGLRVIDDYYLYFKDMSSLQHARSIILHLLRGLELDLNEAKERIVTLPEIIDGEWYNSLRQFKFSNKEPKQIKEIIAYFDMSFRYSEMYPDENILPYSLSKISTTIFQEESWPILEALLLKSLQIEPKVLSYLVKLFMTYKQVGYTLSIDTIGKTLNVFLEEHLNLSNHYEITWTLWFMKLLDIKVSEEATRKLNKSDNSVVILAVLDLNECDLIPNVLDTTEWEQLMTADNLYTEHWLLAYEALIKNWLNFQEDYVETDPFFKILKDNGVSFYDADAELDLSDIRLNRDSEYLPKHDNEFDWDAKNDFRRNVIQEITITEDEAQSLEELFGDRHPDGIFDPFEDNGKQASNDETAP